jgi:malate synthase
MTVYVDRAGLKIAEVLAQFVENDVLPPLGMDAGRFWAGVAEVFADFAPRNKALLAKRDDLQAKIDAWHKARPGVPQDPAAYQAFLREIGYLVPEPGPFKIDTVNVDDELARLAGPQLVVPILNARFLLNAANARWGSLYDALYGTDAIPLSGEHVKGYDPARGAQVVAKAKAFLDQAVPLASGSYTDVTGYSVKDGVLSPALADPSLFAGYLGDPAAPNAILLRHNGIHIELVINRDHPIGKTDPAGLADVVMEAALSTICDLEDSVAAVDADDKVEAYRNWLGLMRGDLEASFE